MRVISASFAAVLLCLTVVSLPAPVRGESLRRPTPDSLARPQALVHKLGLDVSPGALFRTDDFFKGANAAGKEFGTTLSVHLKYAFQFGPETRFGRNYPFTYQGVGLGYNTFFNSAEVGTPVALYVFQHARIAALAERLSLDTSGISASRSVGSPSTNRPIRSTRWSVRKSMPTSIWG